MHPTTRKNNKTTQPRIRQEKTQRKKQHHLCSKNRYKRGKNAGKTQNTSKKIVSTENQVSTNRKSLKGRQNGKTTPRGQPRCSQTRRQQNKKKISVSI